eukprot:11972415-Karenia_brevis.AAC.1
MAHLRICCSNAQTNLQEGEQTSTFGCNNFSDLTATCPAVAGSHFYGGQYWGKEMVEHQG